MNKPKVLLVHNEASPYRLPLFEKLAENVDLTVYFCREKSAHRKWETSPKDCSYEVILGGGSRLGLKVWRLIKREEFDLVILGELGLGFLVGSLVTLLAAKTGAKPLVFWTGFVETEYYRKNKPFKAMAGKWLRKLLVRFSDVCLTYSKMSELYLKQLGVSADKLFRGGQVVPRRLLAEPDVNSKQDGGQLTVLAVGYFKPSKGFDCLIRSFRSLPENARERSRLVIAGTGDQEESLRQLAAGADDIQFPGYVTGKEKANWYARADLFVLPSLHDPWGLVINEAIHYGLPVITTEAAGAKELVDGVGEVIPPDEETALTTALQKLITDEQLRDELALSSKDLSGKLTVESGVEAFMDAIDFCLGGT